MHADLLHRVREAKARYIRETGDYPCQLFLGPKEYLDFKVMCDTQLSFSRTDGGINDECAGMTIIGLMSDGLRVGRTVE